MPGVPLPLSPGDRARWRTAVLTLLQTEHRRGFPHRLHLGRPDRDHLTVTPPGTVPDAATPPEAVLDAAARRQLLDMLLVQLPLDPAPAIWLTRPGEPTVHDEDLAWRAAAVDACAAAEKPCTMVVVTPHGWHDPDTGAGQRWVRLRPRRGRSGSEQE